MLLALYRGLLRLGTMPPGVMSALLTIDPSLFYDLSALGYLAQPLFKHIYPLVRQIQNFIGILDRSCSLKVKIDINSTVHL